MLEGWWKLVVKDGFSEEIMFKMKSEGLAWWSSG